MCSFGCTHNLKGRSEMDLKINLTKNDENTSKTKAYATAVLNGHIAIHGIKLVEADRNGEKSLFVQMPSWVAVNSDGKKFYNDVAYPITAEMRKELFDAVLNEYNNPTEKAENKPIEMPSVKVSLKLYDDENSNIKAHGSITLSERVVIGGIRVVEGKKGAFVQLPAYQDKENEWHDIAHPVTAEFREKLINAVLNKYNALVNTAFIGNTEYKDLGEKDEISYLRVSSEKLINKLAAELDSQGIPYHGKVTDDNKAIFMVNIQDEEALKNCRNKMQKEISSEKKAGMKR